MRLKVISGGQTGADLAGLWVAKILGIETGGVAPKGFETLVGLQPNLASLFGLTESPGGYRVRTVENVANSDLTLVFSRNMRSPGTVLTINSCKNLDKPCFQVPDLHDRELDTIVSYWTGMLRDESPKYVPPANLRIVRSDLPQAYQAVLDHHKTCVINVAGNATKNAHDIFEFTFVGFWTFLYVLCKDPRVEGIDMPKFRLDPYQLAKELKDRYVPVT